MTTLTPRQQSEHAAATYRRVMETRWPDSREAKWAIGWAAGTLWDAMTEGNPEQAYDCALALDRTLREHQARQAAREAEGEAAA